MPRKDSIAIVRQAIRNPATPWVLFSHGTVVFLPGERGDLAVAAAQTLAGWGPVQSGTPSGDFRVTSFDQGWFVGCHHPDIMTLVTPDEVAGSPSDLEVGLLGREKRGLDARELSVVHRQEGDGSEPAQDLPVRLRSDHPVLAACQEALEAEDPEPMTDFLLDGDPALVLEQTSGGLIAHRETKVAYLMDDPWATLYMDTLGNSRTTMVRDGPRGLEVRRRGPFYYLTEQPIEDFPCRLLVTGIDHTGKMKGAAGQAMLARFGPQVEEAAQRALAQSDRLLGTAVLSRRPPPPIGGLHWFAHVVSTPKHTPESPGWLKKAVAGFLDHALEQKIRQVATVALGTNGGISSEEAAKLMLSSCQKWFARHPGVCMQIFFSLPAPKVRQAFEAEFRKQRVFFT